ncbi:MAG TPA: DUF4097 family beta strand repeat-containing protein [Polyangia bacterium]|nr:DUF4097 family beta strand repeat-containing protein [Polyangia bacterium]
MIRWLAIVFVLALPALAWAQHPAPPIPPAPPAPPSGHPVPPIPPMPPMQPMPPMPQPGYPGMRMGRKIVASAEVKGPILLRLDVFSGDVAVVPGVPGKVIVTVTNGAMQGMRLVPQGEDRMQVEFDGRSKLRTGDVRVQLPRQSSVDVTTMSGSVSVSGLGGEARVHTIEGDIQIVGCTRVEANAVSGDVKVADARGPVRVRSVAGSARVSMVGGSASQFVFETTSGDLDWTGTCGKGCRIEVCSMSGDVRLNLSRDSSFNLRYKSHSGDLEDGLQMSTLRSKEKHSGSDIETRYGRGEGTIECQSFSGDMEVRGR